MLRLNCDASFNNRAKKASVTYICRDHNGKIVSMNAKQLKCDLVDVAKAHVVREVLAKFYKYTFHFK